MVIFDSLLLVVSLLYFSDDTLFDIFQDIPDTALLASFWQEKTPHWQCYITTNHPSIIFLPLSDVHTILFLGMVLICERSLLQSYAESTNLMLQKKFWSVLIQTKNKTGMNHHASFMDHLYQFFILFYLILLFVYSMQRSLVYTFKTNK